tara:strand:+ start:4514 stop:7000 length:2487 start_codon:yes stop_codon:yes gene_type:complete
MNISETQAYYFGNEEAENLIQFKGTGNENYYLMVHRQTGEILIFNQEFGFGQWGDRYIGSIQYDASTDSYKYPDSSLFNKDANDNEEKVFSDPKNIKEIIARARELSITQYRNEGDNFKGDGYTDPRIGFIPDVFENKGAENVFIEYQATAKEVFYDSDGRSYIRIPGLESKDNLDGRKYIDISLGSGNERLVIIDDAIARGEVQDGDSSLALNTNNGITSEEILQSTATDIKKEFRLNDLNDEQIERITQIIRDNPTDNASQRYIQAVKKVYPELFEDIKPYTKEDIESMSYEDQWDYKERIAAYQRRQNSKKNLLPHDSNTAGVDVLIGDPCLNDFFGGIEKTLNGFMKRLAGNKLVGNIAALGGGLTQGFGFPTELKSTVGLIKDISRNMVGKMAGALEDKLVTFISGGIKGMTQFFYNTISNPISALAKATGFQSSLANPLGMLFNAMGCVTSKVIDALGKTIEDMLTNMVSSVINPAVCVADQFISGLFNRISNVMDSMIGPFILPIEKMLKPLGAGAIFGLTDVLRKGVNMANKALNLFRCGKGSQADCPTSSVYKIDAGVIPTLSENAQNSHVKKAIDGANDSLKNLGVGITTSLNKFEENVGKLEIFGSKLGDVEPVKCETGAVTKCGYPKIKFFGGGGEGAMGKVIMGRFINNFDTENLRKDVKQTASIIGVDMTYPGEGYEESPYVHFEDNCEQGYGAYGRAIVDFNMNSPTYGQVTDVIMISEGENYPPGAPEDAFVEKILIQDPGNGYSDDDKMEGFDMVVKDGKIAEVKPNRKAYRFLPPMKILTQTGSGAILRPVMTTKTPQIEVEQQIDCVTT